MATWSDTVPSSPSAGDKFSYGGITYTYRVDNTMGVWDAVQGVGSGGGSYAAAVNFNGTSTLSIRGSSNVTSVTDLGTGLYQINFTTDMDNVNYYISVTGADEVGANNRKTDACITAQAVGSVSIGFFGSYSGGGADQEICCVLVFT
jgi:hypothetical protein